MTSATGTESTGMMPVATGMVVVARTAASSIGRLPDLHSVENPRPSTRWASSATTAASSVYGLLLARPIGPRLIMRSTLGPQRRFRSRRDQRWPPERTPSSTSSHAGTGGLPLRARGGFGAGGGSGG